MRYLSVAVDKSSLPVVIVVKKNTCCDEVFFLFLICRFAALTAVWCIKTQFCEVHTTLIILRVMGSSLLRSEESKPRIQLSALSFRHMYNPADTKIHFTTNSWKVNRLWCFTNYVFWKAYRKCLSSHLLEEIALHSFEIYYKVQICWIHIMYFNGIPNDRPITYHEETDKHWFRTHRLILFIKSFEIIH